MQQASQKIIKGEKLECKHCNHDKFWERETLMNTKKMTFFKLDWANKQAKNFICNNCGYYTVKSVFTAVKYHCRS